ncbi:large ribosomal subunit protein mL54-like [Daphnia carinata]|uniref:large ribosomal subunit protein mL54-like n=1 Tax=Daphnia carinata TaxID=120202 RepID=UPI0025804C60|nr:large ribosomal subunit protein mL54-like [Daphnia carinata]
MAAITWVRSASAKLFYRNLAPCMWNIQKADFAKPSGVAGLGSKKAGKLGKLGPVAEKIVLPVETDPEKLVKYVCGSNILKQGQDVELKPDSEYPDWLWSLRLTKPPPLEEMDQNSIQYWRRLRKLNIQRQSRLMKLRKY